MATKVEFVFDPIELAGYDRKDFSPDAIKTIMQDASEIVTTEVLKNCAAQRSSVGDGGAWDGLSTEYANKKKILAGNKKANLELSGDMLSTLKVINRGRTLTLTVDPSQYGKADGHNNFSGESKLPERKFIPDAGNGETFSDDILSQIKRVVEDNVSVGNVSSVSGNLFEEAIKSLVAEGLGIKIRNVD